VKIIKIAAMKNGGFVYIMASKQFGTIYIGSTTDLMVRVLQHKEKTFKGFTADYNVDKLVYYEWHDELTEMVKRERQLKEWNRKWKLRLIMDLNPGWHDLTNEVFAAYGYASPDTKYPLD